MKKINTTYTGGYPVKQNDLKFIQDSYTEVFDNVIRGLANYTTSPIILWGMNLGEDSSSAGAFWYNNMLYVCPEFVYTGGQQQIAFYVHDLRSFQSDGNKLFKNGISRQVFEVHSAFVNEFSTGGYSFNLNVSTLIRYEKLIGTKLKVGANYSTETVMGFIQLATTNEAISGTNTNKAITPAGLTSFYNSKKATPSETVTGTNDIKYVTPLDYKTALEARFATTNDVLTGTGNNIMTSDKLREHTVKTFSQVVVNTTAFYENDNINTSLRIIEFNNGLRMLSGNVKSKTISTPGSILLVTAPFTSSYIMTGIGTNIVTGTYYMVYANPGTGQIFIQRAATSNTVESNAVIYFTLMYF